MWPQKSTVTNYHIWCFQMFLWYLHVIFIINTYWVDLQDIFTCPHLMLPRYAYGESCLKRTLNKPKLCIKGSLNSSPNVWNRCLSCINRTLVYSEFLNTKVGRKEVQFRQVLLYLFPIFRMERWIIIVKFISNQLWELISFCKTMKMVPTKKIFQWSKNQSKMCIEIYNLLFVRKDIDVNKHARPSNFTYRHKLK
jgi:hypothetical protein